jgi:hypothetical protein
LAPPGDFEYEELDCNNVKFTWTPPPATASTPLSGYNLVYNAGNFNSAGGAQVNISVNLPSTVTEYTATGIEALCNAAGYKNIVSKIAALNEAGYSEYAFYESTTPISVCPPVVTVPPKPTNLVGTAGILQVKLDWSPSTGATGYKGKYYPVGEPSTTALTDYGSVLTKTIQGLTPGVNYRFEIYAYNSAGNSDQPATVDATPLGIGVQPPTNLQGTTSSGTVALAWNASPTSGVTYKVTYNPGNVVTSGIATTTKTFTGLTNGTAYTFSVVAVLSGVESSAVTGAYTPSGTIGDPPPVTSSLGPIDYVTTSNFKIASTGANRLVVQAGTWKIYEGIAQQQLTHIKWELIDLNGPTESIVRSSEYLLTPRDSICTTTTNPSPPDQCIITPDAVWLFVFTFTELADAVYTGNYRIELAAKNNSGGYFDPIKFPFTIPNAAIGTDGVRTVRDLTQTNIDSGVKLNWSVGTSGLQIASFDIQVFKDKEYLPLLSKTGLSATLRSYDLMGLTNNEYYTVLVQSRGINGEWGPPSIPLLVYPQATLGELGEVDDLTLTSTQNSITASWGPVTGATKYEISYSTGSTGPFGSARVVQAPDLQAIITGLNADTTYYVKVKAGRGLEWSIGQIVSIDTLGSVSTVFDPVQIAVQASSVTENSINLVWDKPFNTGSSALDYYTIYYIKTTSALPDPEIKIVDYTGAVRQSTDISTFLGVPLEAETQYNVYVIATNESGETSPIPTPVMFTTAAITSEEEEKPFPVRMLSGVQNDKDYTFTWSRSYDQQLVEYKLYTTVTYISTITGEPLTDIDPVDSVVDTTLNSHTVTLDKSNGIRIAGYVRVVATRVQDGVTVEVLSDPSNVITIVAIDDTSTDVRTTTVKAKAFYNVQNTAVPTYLLSARVRKQFPSTVDISKLPKQETESKIYNPTDDLIEKLSDSLGFNREVINITNSYDSKANDWQFVNEVGFAYLDLPDYSVPLEVYLTLHRVAEPLGLSFGSNPCKYAITTLASSATSMIDDKVFLDPVAYKTVGGIADNVLASLPLTTTEFNNIPISVIYNNIKVLSESRRILPLKFMIDAERNPLTNTKLPTGHNNVVLERRLNTSTGICEGISAIVKYIEVQAPKNYTLTGYDNKLYLEWDEPYNPSLTLLRYEIEGFYNEKDEDSAASRKRHMVIPPIQASTIQDYITRLFHTISTFNYTKEEDTNVGQQYAGVVEPDIFYTLKIRAIYDHRGSEVTSPYTYELSMKTKNVETEEEVKASLTGLGVSWPVQVQTAVYTTPDEAVAYAMSDHLISFMYNGQRKEVEWKDYVPPFPFIIGDVWFAPSTHTLDDTIARINNYIAITYPDMPVEAVKEETQLKLQVTAAGSELDTLAFLPADLIEPPPPSGTAPRIKSGVLTIFGSVPSVQNGGYIPKVYEPNEPLNVNIFAGKDDVWVDWKEPGNNGGSPVYKYVVYIDVNNTNIYTHVVYKDEHVIGPKHYGLALSDLGPVIEDVDYSVSISAFNSEYESLRKAVGPVRLADVIRYTKTGDNTYKTLTKEKNLSLTERDLLENQPYQENEEYLTITPKIHFDAIETSQPTGIRLRKTNLAPGSVSIRYKNSNTTVLHAMGNGILVDNGNGDLLVPSYVDECNNIIIDKKVGLIDYAAGIISCYLPNIKNSNVLIKYRYKEQSIDIRDYTWFSTPQFDLEIKTQRFPLTYAHLNYILKNMNKIRPSTTVARKFSVQ